MWPVVDVEMLFLGGNLEILGFQEIDITKNGPFQVKQTVSKPSLARIMSIIILICAFKFGGNGEFLPKKLHNIFSRLLKLFSTVTGPNGVLVLLIIPQICSPPVKKLLQKFSSERNGFFKVCLMFLFNVFFRHDGHGLTGEGGERGGQYPLLYFQLFIPTPALQH